MAKPERDPQHDEGPGGATATATADGGERPHGRSGPPWSSIILGVVVVVVLAVVGIVVVRGGQHRQAATNRLTQSTTTAAATAATAATSSPATKPAAPPTKSAATPQAASQPATVAGLKKPSGDSLKQQAREIAAKYENSPLYQIEVGASPATVRATHPINLYIPPHEPMYDIAKHQLVPPTTSEDAFIRWMKQHSPEKSTTFLRQKWRIAQIAIRDHAVTHKRVLDAFLLTPREWFVRRYNYPNAYERTSLPIGYGQTITNPGLVIRMTNALDPQPNQRVLEIGTGSGYQSAFLSELSNYVYTVEIVRPLGAETNQIYLLHTPQMPQYANIHRRLYDGYYGWPKYAPFDRIIVTTGIDHIPPDLLKELKPGGIMLIPVGPPNGQTVLKITKTVGANGQIHLKRQDIFHGIKKEVFVPFTAASGGTHNGGKAAK